MKFIGTLSWHSFLRHKFNLYVLFLLLLCISMPSLAEDDISDFPIIEYKATYENSPQIFYISGDGGMNEFSKSLCRKFNDKGYSVIALDAKKYFWKEKTPEMFIKDISTLILHYQSIWHGDSFVVMGYSFGADVGAFIPARLPVDLVKKMKFSVFLNPSTSTDFEIKLMDMLGKEHNNRKYNIILELNSLEGTPVICLMSEDEISKISGKIQNEYIKVKILPGDHRFNFDYNLIVNTVIALL